VENLVKGGSEQKPHRTTPAMAPGLVQAPGTWSRVLAERLFPAGGPLPASWREIL